MLKIQDIHSSYGAIKAIKGVSLVVEDGELVCVIGANGAGKSTLLKTIVGLIQPHEGKVYFENNDITRIPTHKIARLGISLVPEGRLLFNELTVRENLVMGAYTRNQEEMERDFITVFGLFPRLAERLNQRAGTLSGGEQQMLAVGRALMGAPKLLILDEPSLGIAPRLVSDIYEAIEQLNIAGLTILLVEQNANMAFSVSKRGYVMGLGRITLEGPTLELKENPEVRKAYLGG
jgi:branched-chain amino acid transport system ATP-binding protein